jgi:hypothetical protein
LAQFTWPVRIGAMPTISNGMMTSRPMTFCTWAVLRMPRCWIANVHSISTAPIQNVALRENDTGPREWV